MSLNYYSGGAVNENIIKWVSIGIQVLTCVLIIVVIIMVSGKSSESFTIRGYSYPGGQMLYGDVPEKISAGGQEYDNPLYLQISRRWEPTDKKVNGYTVWKQKGQSSDQSTSTTTAATTK